MTPQEEIRFRQLMANQMSARQPMLRDQMPDMNPTPPYGALPIATPTPRNPLEEAARFRGLLGPAINYRPPYSREEIERLMRDEEINRVGPNPYARGLRPPTDAERERFDATNPEMPLNDLALARLEAERLARLEAERLSGAPINPLPPGFGDRTPPSFNPLPPDFMDEARRNAMADYYQRMGINPGRPMDGSPPGFSPNPYYYTGGTPIPPVGGEMAADPEPEEYDGFVDSGTGRRGYLDFKYMPTPMDTSVTMAQAAPVTMAQAAPVTMAQAAPVTMASTAYNAPPVASTAYMPPATDAPVNTAYMPSRRTVPVDTTYRPPAQANTTYMPSSAPTYGMSSTPSYGMSNAQTTTPTYGGQIREPSFSPNQAGKYKADGPRLKNTGGLFNDLNAFFGRPQT